MAKRALIRPYLDRQVRRVFNNMDAALVALKAGDLDAMSLQPCQHLRQTSGARFEKQFAKHLYFSPSYTWVGWNNAHPIFSDERVRQAMTYLTNRQQMVEDAPLRTWRGGGWADVLVSPGIRQDALQPSL